MKRSHWILFDRVLGTLLFIVYTPVVLVLDAYDCVSIAIWKRLR